MIRVCLLLLLYPAFGHLLADDFRLPSIPDRGSGAAAFVPAGWKILKEAQGDLNKDKQFDLVLVLGSAVESETYGPDWERPRLLVILLKENEGYRKSAASARAVLCRGCGGVFGDPFSDLRIQRGAIVLSHYGGSRDRWGFTHRFRFQRGDWLLIGRTKVEHDTLTHKSYELDENLLTGDTIEIRIDEKGKKRRSKTRKPRRPLISLSKFSVIN